MISFLAPVDAPMRATFPSDKHPHRAIERTIQDWLAPLATVADIGCGQSALNLPQLIEKFALTKPLQGWIFCGLKKP